MSVKFKYSVEEKNPQEVICTQREEGDSMSRKHSYYLPETLGFSKVIGTKLKCF